MNPIAKLKLALKANRLSDAVEKSLKEGTLKKTLSAFWNLVVLSLPLAGAYFGEVLSQNMKGSTDPAIVALGTLIGSIATLLKGSPLPRTEWSPQERQEKTGNK